MKKLLIQFLFVMAVGSLSLSPLFAVDIVTKKSDGKNVNGTISAMTKTELTLKRTGGEETIASNDIAQIVWEGGGGELKLGYSDENNGRYDSATQRYTKAKSDAKNPSDFLKGEFEYVIARVAGKQGLADPDKREAAIQKLQGAQKAYPEHIRYYESVQLLCQVQLAAKDFNGVRSTLEALKKAPWSDLNLAGQITEARVLMSEGKIDEAIGAFNAAANAGGESPAEMARKYEAKLGHASCLVAQTKYDDALKILEEVTEKGPSEDSSVQAEAYVLQGRALQGLGRNKEAALSYLYVDVIFPKEAAFDAEALYQLSNLWKQVQHPDRSVEAAGKLVQLYPNSEWRRKLSQ